MYKWVSFTLQDAPGSAAIIFYEGCNCRCNFCYNVSLLKEDENSLNFHDILLNIKDIQQKNLRNNKKFLTVNYLVLSGGECLRKNPRQFIETLRFIFLAKKLGLKIGIYTNGLNFTYLNILVRLKLINFLNIDYKQIVGSFNEMRVIDGSKEKNILKSILLALKSNIPHVRLNTTITKIHTLEYLKKMYDEIAPIKMQFKLNDDILSTDTRIWSLTPVQTNIETFGSYTIENEQPLKDIKDLIVNMNNYDTKSRIS